MGENTTQVKKHDSGMSALMNGGAIGKITRHSSAAGLAVWICWQMLIMPMEQRYREENNELQDKIVEQDNRIKQLEIITSSLDKFEDKLDDVSKNVTNNGQTLAEVKIKLEIMENRGKQ